MTMPTRRVRFGQCDIDVARREVRLDGRIQDVPAKAYEVLMLLIDDRHRAVPKRELVERVWMRQAVSDSVPARTVMQARRAIGDTASSPIWIRTLHGFGYRFVGDVTETADDRDVIKTADADHADIASELEFDNVEDLNAQTEARVALAPCENATGDAAVDWVVLGLPDISSHMLRADAAMETLGPTQVLEAMERLSVAPPIDTPIRRMCVELQASHVATSTLRRQGRDLWLDYALHDRSGGIQMGSVRGPDPHTLARRLARAVAGTVGASVRPDVAFLAEDPFAQRAFARAVEFHRQQQWNSAVRLLDMVCSMQPGSVVARVWRVHAMSMSGDSRLWDEGDRLAGDPAHDTALRAVVHASLAQACAQLPGPVASRRRGLHVQQADLLLREVPRTRWATLARYSISAEVLARGNRRDARRLLIAVDSDAEALGMACLRARIGLDLATLERTGGDLLGARDRTERVLGVFRSCGRRSGGAVALAALAELNASLGLTEKSLRQAREALRDSRRFDDAPAEATLLHAAAVALSHAGASDELDALIAERSHLGADDRATVRAPFLAVKAMAAMANGKGDAAFVHVQAALKLAASGCCVPLERRLLLLALQIDTLTGRASVGSQARLESLPEHADDVEARGALLHARAVAHAMHGNLAAACADLTATLECVPLGAAHALARIDAAWLMLLQGRHERASALLAGAGVWRHHHPAGMLCEALLQAVQGKGLHAMPPRLPETDKVPSLASLASTWRPRMAELWKMPRGTLDLQTLRDVPPLPSLVCAVPAPKRHAG